MVKIEECRDEHNRPAYSVWQEACDEAVWILRKIMKCTR